MGRRSLATERTDTILDAVEACILEFGYRDTTITKIARRAGMSPGHVTHYLPTKEAIHAALIDRVVERIKSRLSTIRGLDGKSRLTEAMEAAFGVEELPLGRLVDELIAVSHTDEATREALASLYGAFERWWDDVVVEAFPDADDDLRRDVTCSLVWLTHGARLSVGLGTDDDALLRARRVAEQLIDSLRAVPVT